MCCFSRPVQSVSRTRIFCRFTEVDLQAVVYAMTIEAAEDLAMVLPLPVAPARRQDAVTFVNLEGYPRFFDHLHNAFPQPKLQSLSFGGPPAAGNARTLKVEQVGSFEASYVPGIEDFARLDERFRLPAGTWEKLPRYADYGFAVFKLKPGKQKIHPMALTFRSRSPGTLFFPTVHIHDGKVHDREDFDHTLYAQGWTNAVISGLDWEESPGAARGSIEIDKTKGLVWADGHIYRRTITGTHKNEDILAKARAMGG